MRFLGQEIYKDLNDKEVRRKVEDKLEYLLQKTDRDMAARQEGKEQWNGVKELQVRERYASQ